MNIELDKNELMNKLFITVMGTKDNEEFLKDVPHKEIEDMSIVYRLLFNTNGKEVISEIINYKILSEIGIDEETLDEVAFENSPRLRPPRLLTPISAILDIPENEKGDGELYLVSTDDCTLGAACLFYPEMMQAYARMLESDYYILPSSIHEFLLISDTIIEEPGELISMVKEINAIEVSKEDKLTDNVYHFQLDGKVFETLDKYMERKGIE